ncbi:MAG: LCP family protein [Ilumatobacteraceae bacterium]
MSSIASVRRRRTMMMVGASVVVVLALGALLAVGALALARYEGGKDRTVDATPIPVTHVGMLASVDDQDALTGVTMFVTRPPAADGAAAGGGSIVPVPVSADVLAGLDGQRQSLAEAYATDGPDGLVLAVESLLSLTVDQFLVADPDQLAEILQPLSPVDVQLPDDVVDTQGGDDVVLYSAGDASLSGKQLSDVLNARRDGQTDADRRPTYSNVWEGIAAAVGEGRTLPSEVAPSNLQQLVDQVYAGPAESRHIAAGPLPAGTVAPDRDVEVLDRGDAVMVFASISPSSMSAPSTGLVFRVEAPPGYEDKVKWTVDALLYLNSNVGWVFQQGPVQEQTKVLLSDASLSNDALGAENLFGDSFEQGVIEQPIEGIDVIIQLGTSFLEDPTTGATLPSTTTTTTTP